VTSVCCPRYTDHSTGYGPSLGPKSILSFVNAGGNVLLALSSATGTPSAVSSLLLEFDIGIPSDRFSTVVDHFNYDTASSAEKHDTLLVPRPAPLRPDVMDFFGGDGILAVPHAVGQDLGSSSPLLAPILRAGKTSFTYNPKEEDPEAESDDGFATGSQISLVSAMQARNSARFTVVGSLEMLSDKWFNAKVKGSDGKSVATVNREFAQQLTEWTFKEVGVLKAEDIEHHLVSEGDAQKADVANTTQVGFANPEIYRVKNDVVCYYPHPNWMCVPNS
jgi:oligosaccharyltransferase complex subunit beta